MKATLRLCRSCLDRQSSLSQSLSLPCSPGACLEPSGDWHSRASRAPACCHAFSHPSLPTADPQYACSDRRSCITGDWLQDFQRGATWFISAPTSTCSAWSQVLIFTRSAHFRPGTLQYPSALSACAPQNWADDLAGLYAFLYLSQQAGRIMLWLLLTKLELLLTTLGLLLAVSLVLRLQC